MVLADPDQPIGMNGAAAKRRRLFEDDRLQAERMGGQRRSEARDAGSQDADVAGTARRDHRMTSLLRCAKTGPRVADPKLARSQRRISLLVIPAKAGIHARYGSRLSPG